MCDFAVEPEIGLLGLAEILELLEELGVDNVRRVKAQSVDAELVDPHFNGAEKVVDNLVVSQIELYEVVVTCPALVPEGVAVAASSVEVEVLEPAAVARIPLFLLNVVEGEELSAYVVKYAVEDNSDSVGVKGIADFLEGLVVAEAFVNHSVVDGVVAVVGAFKERVKDKRVDAETLEVVDTVVYFIKTVIELVVVVTRRAAKTERIDVVDNAFVDVTHDGVSFVNA